MFMEDARLEAKSLESKLNGLTYTTIKELQGIQVSGDLEHWYSIDLKKLKNGTLKLSGFHLDANNFIENCGIFQIKNRRVDKFGCYGGEVWYDGQRIHKDKTFFPSHWTREQVLDKVIEALQNVKSITQKNSNSNFEVRGLTSEKIEIEMIINKNGKILTAYPLVK